MGKYTWDYMDEIHIDQFKEADKCYRVEKELEAPSYRRATILPYRTTEDPARALGGILNMDNKWIPESGQHIVGADVVDGYPVDEVEESDLEVVWFGYYHNHWGHFLTEMISRCWYLLKHNPVEEDFYVAYAIKTDACNVGLQGTFKEFLNILGVPDERILLVNKPTRFNEINLPDISCVAGQWYTDKYVAIFDKMISECQGEGYDKVYLTRLKGKGLASTQIGEKAIMKTFRGNGYKVVAPETLSLREQISIYSSAKEMVVVAGTLMHNVLFCNPDTKFTILSRDTGNNAYQPLINDLKKVSITYIDCHLSFFPTFAGGPFLFYFSDNFRKYCKDKNIACDRYAEGKIRLHIKLMWYFIMYLQNMSAETVDHWNMEEKYNVGMMSRYKFYRNKLKDYDDPTERKIRNGMARVVKKVFGL